MDDPARQWTKAQIEALINELVKARRWTTNDIVTIIGAVGIFLTGLMTAWNGRDISRISDRQVVHEQKADDIKVALESEKAVVDRKLERIEKSTAAVENRIQVMGSPKINPQ